MDCSRTIIIFPLTFTSHLHSYNHCMTAAEITTTYTYELIHSTCFSFNISIYFAIVWYLTVQKADIGTRHVNNISPVLKPNQNICDSLCFRPGVG